MKALVIDDSRAMRCIIGQILKSLGFEILEASNGQEGLQRLDGGDHPKLVMVDWNMPVMDGLAFVRAMRSRQEFNEIRIMMVTTETEMTRMSEALAQGADEYVMKPFTRDVILQKLEQMQVDVRLRFRRSGRCGVIDRGARLATADGRGTRTNLLGARSFR